MVVKVKIGLDPSVTPGPNAATALEAMAARMRLRAEDVPNPLTSAVAEAVAVALEGLAARVRIQLAG